jgi:hypothetical protein
MKVMRDSYSAASLWWTGPALEARFSGPERVSVDHTTGDVYVRSVSAACCCAVSATAAVLFPARSLRVVLFVVTPVRAGSTLYCRVQRISEL